jgi:hypothetical protein
MAGRLWRPASAHPDGRPNSRGRETAGPKAGGALIPGVAGLTKAHATSKVGFREHTSWYFTIIPWLVGRGWVGGLGGMITKSRDLPEHQFGLDVSTASFRQAPHRDLTLFVSRAVASGCSRSKIRRSSAPSRQASSETRMAIRPGGKSRRFAIGSAHCRLGSSGRDEQMFVLRSGSDRALAN